MYNLALHDVVAVVTVTPLTLVPLNEAVGFDTKDLKGTQSTSGKCS